MTMITLNETQGPFARLAEALRGWKQRRDTRAELQRLSDRDLSDIGIVRADIDDVVSHRA